MSSQLDITAQSWGGGVGRGVALRWAPMSFAVRKLREVNAGMEPFLLSSGSQPVEWYHPY